MAKAKKEVKEATISETKEKKKKEEIIEEVEEVVEEKIEEEVEAKEPERVEKKKKKGFFRGIREEMHQVVWPSAGNIVKSTIAVVVICIFLALFFEAIILFMAWLKGLFV